MFAPIAGRRRLTACMWLTFLALGLAAGLALALPLDTSACPGPSGAGQPDCMNHALGHAATVALLTSLGAALAAHVLVWAVVTAGSWARARVTVLSPRLRTMTLRSPSRPSPGSSSSPYAVR